MIAKSPFTRSNIGFVTLSSWASKLVAILTQLISINILLTELGVDAYAQYIVVVSVGSWFLLLDFGFGIALQNAVSAKTMAIKNNGFLTVGLLIPLMLLILFLVSLQPIIPLLAPIIRDANSTISLGTEIARINTVAMIFGISALGSISFKIYYALGKGHTANTMIAFSAIIGLFFIKTLLHKSPYDPVISAIVLYFLPNCTISIFVFFRLLSKFWEKPALNFELFSHASKFWLIALMSAATLQVDYIIMSKFLNSKEIISYLLVTKTFGLMYFTFAAILTAVQPLFSELYAHGRHQNIRKVVYIYNICTLVAAAIFTIIFCIFKNDIASLYFGTKIADIDSSFIILVGIYNAILLTISAYTAALQSANITKVFLIWTPIQALVSILGQIACVGEWGIHGIVLGLMISYILIPLWIIPLTFKKRFNLAT